MKRYQITALDECQHEWSTTVVAHFIEDAEAAFVRDYPESRIVKIERLRK